MRRHFPLPLFVVALALVCQTAGPAETMVGAARKLLESLPPALRAQAQLPFDSDDRTTWNYVPIARKGVSLKALDANQRRAAMSLLRTGLSEKGYVKAEAIRAL